MNGELKKLARIEIDPESPNLQLANLHAIQMIEGTLDATQSALDAGRVRRGEALDQDSHATRLGHFVRKKVDNITDLAA